MKKVLFTSLLAAIALVFVSCGNSFTGNNPNVKEEPSSQSEKAKVSFSTILGADSNGARMEFLPQNVTEKDIEKLELKVCSVFKNEKGALEELEYLFTSEDSSTTNKKVFEKTDKKTAIELFEETTIELDLGMYSFYVDLFAKNIDGTLECVQSGALKEQQLKNGDNSFSIETKYVESGELYVKYTWKIPEIVTQDSGSATHNSVSTTEEPIAAVKMGLYSDAKATEVVKGYESEKLSLGAVKSGEDSNEVTHYGIYHKFDIPNGTYYLKVELFDSDGDILNTYIDKIVIYGYRTQDTKELGTDYNVNYKVTYHLNGGEVVEGKEEIFYAKSEDSDDVYIQKHNQYTGVVLPDASCVQKEDYEFAGWYTTNEEGLMTDDFRITRINAYEENCTKNVDVYAKWIVPYEPNPSGGTITIDDGMLDIKCKKVPGVFYKNAGEMTFTVTKDGKSLINDDDFDDDYFDFSAKLFYGGRDLEDYGYNLEKWYGYNNEDDEGYFKIYKPLAVGGKYQVVIYAEYKNVSCSQTFDIQVEDYNYFESEINKIDSSSLYDAFVKLNGVTVFKVTGKAEYDKDHEIGNNDYNSPFKPLMNVLDAFPNIPVDLDLSELDATKIDMQFEENVQKLILPNNLEYICEKAFSELTNLKELTIPKTVTKIGTKAFSSAVTLTIEENTNETWYSTTSQSMWDNCGIDDELTLPECETVDVSAGVSNAISAAIQSNYLYRKIEQGD